MAKESICVKVESTMKAKIHIIAKREGRGMADVFRSAMLLYTEKHEDKYGKINAEEINQIQLFGDKGGK
jgi:1-aminocyclopropane-1-carboxylate deaminase/D-cysteine desulfhydrase-like pyridoxal-dependent ACC family enzyme